MFNFIQIGRKKPLYYKGLLVNADPRLHDQVMRIINHELLKGSSILDLGAGEGAMSQRLSDAGFKVISIDINPERFKADGPVFYRLDFNDREEVRAFVDRYRDYFDAVIGMEVIEHLENPWEYVRLLKKITKRGGKLIVTTPNTASWLSRFCFLFTGRFFSFDDQSAEEYGHVAPISPWELLLIFRREDIINIRIFEGGFLPSLWITSNLLIILSTLLAPLLRPFMRGQSKGYCIIIIGEK